MTIVKKNVIANFLGRGVGAVASLLFVPLYIEILGAEAYGLVGLFVTLQATFSLLDFGLTTAANRELARMSVPGGTMSDGPDFVRTLEYVYWILAFVVALITISLASYLVHNWINIEALSHDTVTNAMRIIAVAFAFQWPLKLYQGGLIGLQKQIPLNVIEIAFSIVRAGGAAFVLIYVSPTIQSFFVWQLVIAFTQVGCTRWVLWRSLRAVNVGRSPSFKGSVLRRVWRFAAGMTGIALVSYLLTQMDKIILSRMLSLSEFGYYMIATAAAGTLYRLIGPIYNAVFPRMAQLVGIEQEEELKTLYHKSCQYMSVAVIPVAAVGVVFSSQLFRVWIIDDIVVNKTHHLFALLLSGSALHGLMNIPYGLQLAFGWTGLAFWTNATAVLFFIPLLVLLVTNLGPVGGALSWLLLNIGYVVVNIQLMHRRLLRGEMWLWYWNDVGKTALASVAAALIFFALMPESLGRVGMLFYLILAYALVLTTAGIVAPEVRRELRSNVDAIRLKYAL